MERFRFLMIQFILLCDTRFPSTVVSHFIFWDFWAIASTKKQAQSSSLNKNIIDPIKLIFDKTVYQTSWEEMVGNEIFRQRDKSNNNDIGYFQLLLKSRRNHHHLIVGFASLYMFSLTRLNSLYYAYSSFQHILYEPHRRLNGLAIRFNIQRGFCKACWRDNRKVWREAGIL